MKYLNFLTCFIFLFFFLFLGEIRPQCDETNCLGYYTENNSNAIIAHTHDPDGIGNCIGYAIAETQQSYLGSICGQSKSISIDEAYAKKYWMTWGFYSNVGNFNVNNFGWIRQNDILIWDTQPTNPNWNLLHAAVVTSVGYNSISIKYIYKIQSGNSV